ncbi:M14 family metallopeptidase [Aquimarina sp. 2201CG5-10]|uniref:M14 family metallopeptidase n=1 Tax=Aquimarina callyspongiae TaxID=3098150 RepID=UPI002AB4E00D|nr:M14 family metallopeptidase [Aquimarina sp. 2201CG5-10]MDY8134225.1 M14 family metallopeptidase [Aquimarina sp. 2201CG5-10]
MQKTLLLVSFLFLISCNTSKKQTSENIDFTTTFEKSNGTETPTYPEVIDYYHNLANTYPQIDIREIGMTDSGNPLHLVTLNPDQVFDFEKIKKTKRILLINNGIHPGESDGIDATMLLFRDIVQGTIKAPENTVLAAIPVYNIGGALNRNSTTRTNQNGPKAYGFRGNARNYDLNRDFIKNDTKNAQAFATIFHLVQPDVFIDNHVSNGADYQYTLTHLFTQHNKLGNKLGNYLHTEMHPQLETSLKEKNWDITPYVNVWGTTPDKGWGQFMDSPRYSTGYTTLWNTLGMMVETHMLKPYKPRVEGTYELMRSMIDITEKDGDKIRALRENAFIDFPKQNTYPVQWKTDTSQVTKFQFKGYEGEFIDSEITGVKRLKYDQNKPYTREVSYKNYFIPTTEIVIPEAYVIPQGWWSILDPLQLNQIEFQVLKKDTTIAVEAYHIKDYKSRKSPFEGHYLHYGTSVNKNNEHLSFKKGDILIPTNQKGFRYLIETLEPEAPDSFFNWNFFDTILQQKEGFSPYVWEDKALELLQNNNELKLRFEEKKKDTAFSKNWYAQLDWLHKQSDNYEKAHLRYPVYRILK